MFLDNVKAAELRNIALIGNKSLGNGGGIYINGGDDKQTYKLVNIFATGNSCKQYGGGICVAGKGR
ncbi:MAG: hypothetical protein LBN39_10930, partial [Planctomycetaceae bacterium]|nr:hypothetical protein [Planctomycetaceae bacterium]